MAGFFSAHPNFTKTSFLDHGDLKRMDARHEALITAQASHIKGKRILDLGSHDGRFTFAALEARASHVCGVEARPELIERARSNLALYGADPGRFEFHASEMLAFMARQPAGRFDTVFCFGVLYHLLDHLGLFKAIRRLEPATVIIDTWVSLDPRAVIELREEPADVISEGVPTDGLSSKTTLTGVPSRAALELYLKRIGYRWKYHPWQAPRSDNFDGLVDYFHGGRVTLVAEPA